MKYGLIIGGLLLVAAAMLVSPFNAHIGEGKAPASKALGQAIERHVSGVPEYIVGGAEWKQYEVEIFDKRHVVYVREYPEPVLVGKAMEGFVPSKTSRRSAFGAYALGLHVARTGSVEDRAQLFEDPAKVMAHFDELAELKGGWDVLRADLRK